jgi:hypothetical protein
MYREKVPVDPRTGLMGMDTQQVYNRQRAFFNRGLKLVPSGQPVVPVFDGFQGFFIVFVHGT